MNETGLDDIQPDVTKVDALASDLALCLWIMDMDLPGWVDNCLFLPSFRKDKNKVSAAY